MGLASFDGAIVPVEEARLPVTDEGLLRGDGVFEVLRLYGGVPYALDEHLARMRRSAVNARLDVDVEALAADAAALLAAEQPGDALLRLAATRGGRRIALIEPLPEHAPSITLGIVTYAPTRVLSGVKTLSYGANMLATRLARERGFDEALLATPHGRLLEAPTASIFVVVGDELRTPPLDDHILNSITRRRVLEAAGARQTPVTSADLERAPAALLASTTREVQPVRRIEGHELDPGHPLVLGAVERTRALIEASLAEARA